MERMSEGRGRRGEDTETASGISRSFWTTEVVDDEGIAHMRRIEAAHVNESHAIKIGLALDRIVSNARAGLKGNACVIYGVTGSGKSHLLDRFAARPEFTPYDLPSGEATISPVIHVTAPSPCTLKSLGHAIYDQISETSLPRSLLEHEIWFRLRTQLAGRGVRIVVIDEMHHILVGRKQDEREKVAETLKALLLGSPLRKYPGRHFSPVNLVIAGMPTVQDFINQHKQLRRRCAFYGFKPVPSGGKGIKQVTKHLQLIEERIEMDSGLSLGDMPLRFIKASEGYLGFVALLVKQAAIRALDSKRTTIDRVRDLAEIFEEIFECGEATNPFLVSNVAMLGPSKLLGSEGVETRLRGKKEVVD